MLKRQRKKTILKRQRKRTMLGMRRKMRTKMRRKDMYQRIQRNWGNVDRMGWWARALDAVTHVCHVFVVFLPVADGIHIPAGPGQTKHRIKKQPTR